MGGYFKSSLRLDKKFDTPLNYLLDGLGTLLFLLIVPLLIHHYAGKNLALNAILHGLAIALILFVLEYLGHFAHINPAVTFLHYLLGRHTIKETLMFFSTQILAIYLAYIIWNNFLYKYLEK